MLVLVKKDCQTNDFISDKIVENNSEIEEVVIDLFIENLDNDNNI